MSLGGDLGNVQEDDALDKLASLLYSRNDKLDRKVKRHNSKVRRLLTTEVLVRGKNPCDRGEDNLTVSPMGGVASLEAGVSYLSEAPFPTKSKLSAWRYSKIFPMRNCRPFLSELFGQKRESSFQ